MMAYDISDEILNAYVDNELDAVEYSAVLGSISTDSALRARACGLWQMKQMVRGAYPLPPQKSALAGRRFAAPQWAYALAASLLLMLGSFSGWLVRDHQESDGLTLQQVETIRTNYGRAVVHLFSDEPARVEAALRIAEQLAGTKTISGQPLQVELLTNGPGVSLLRVGGSPYSSRIIDISRAHGNLHMVACREAIERMGDRGVLVNLLPAVEVAASAETRLAARLSQGWRYVQI